MHRRKSAWRTCLTRWRQLCWCRTTNSGFAKVWWAFYFYFFGECLMLMHGVVRHVIIYIDALHEDLAIFESPMALIGAACLCRLCVEWGRYEGDTRLKLLFVCRS